MTDPTSPDESQANDTADAYDSTDVEYALSRDTADGRGDGDISEADFEAYEAGEDVTAYQKEDEV